MTDQRTFPHSPQSIARARRYAIDTLAGVPSEVSDTVAVLVSELATNSVRHAGSDFTVSIERELHQIRIAVTDAGAGVPALRSPTPRDRSGRGLQIVRALADTWGVTDTADQPGKTVWFTVALQSQRRGREVDDAAARPARETPPGLEPARPVPAPPRDVERRP